MDVLASQKKAFCAIQIEAERHTSFLVKVCLEVSLPRSLIDPFLYNNVRNKQGIPTDNKSGAAQALFFYISPSCLFIIYSLFRVDEILMMNDTSQIVSLHEISQKMSSYLKECTYSVLQTRKSSYRLSGIELTLDMDMDSTFTFTFM
jgi:hypothetical protein